MYQTCLAVAGTATFYCHSCASRNPGRLAPQFIGGFLKLIYRKERKIMKTKNQYLILAVFTTILTVPALANVEPTLPEDPPHILIGWPHPELAGIEELYADIMAHVAEPNKNVLFWKELDKLIRDRLKNAGITIAEDDVDKINPDLAIFLKKRLNSVRNLKFRSGNIPKLRVDIEMITLDDSQQYIFRIQTSLVRTVALQSKPNLHFHADVWKKASQMQTVSLQNMPAAITKVVLEQVDEFIADYLAANPPDKRAADANDIAVALPIVPDKQTTPLVKPTTAEYKYVASKNSKVFHKPDCRWAKRIKPENLVGYNSRDEAIEAGKRPCKFCKP